MNFSTDTKPKERFNKIKSGEITLEANKNNRGFLIQI